MTHKLIASFGVALWLMSGSAIAVAATTLAPAVLQRVEAATFEVVQAKPTQDPLAYAKPLPLDLLPYQERIDKYHSTGTAFALGHGRYVTSARVLMAGMRSLWGPPELRDAKGNVYAIDKIEKFGLRRNFVVFTLKTQAGDDALAVNTRPAMDQPVFAIGNALGTGVVVRSGLYTSDTPEPLDGAWKWMRFSAAASPGNGGGPLLDQTGKVVGLVVGDSPGENLNYALPITQVLAAPEDEAVADIRSVSRLDVMDAQQQGVFKATFALPMTLADFYRNFGAQWDAYRDQQRKALLSRESANLFPRGDGARHLLYLSVYPDAFPQVIMRQSDGIWHRFQNDAPRLELADNGYVHVSNLGALGLVHIRRPDDVQAAAFYNDAKVRMDLLASTGAFKRTVGSERVRITSLGSPGRQSSHVDRWQRPWHVAVWPLAFANAVVVAYELPVPDGCVMLMREVPAADEHATFQDLAELTNFIYVSYDGRLSQWRQFLQESALLPSAFKDIHIDFQYGQRFSYNSSRLDFSFTPQVQAIEPDSQLWLGFRFFLDHGVPVWDAADVMLWKDSGQDDSDHITIQRFIKPPRGVGQDLADDWQKVAGRQHPYDGVPRTGADVTKVDAVVAPPGNLASTVLYSAFIAIDGSDDPAVIRAKLKSLLQTISVKK